MPLLKEEAGFVSASTIVVFLLLNLQQNLRCRVHFVSEILYQDLCSPSCWCVYHMYSSVCWDLFSPHIPPIKTRYKVA